MNSMRILRLIWQEKKISRVDIASTLSMDKSTVTKITSELTSKGLVVETESGESGPMGGRKPVFLEINGSRACVGGIEINPENMYLCLVSLKANILFEHTQKIDNVEFEKIGLEGYFKIACKMLHAEAKKRAIPLAAIGVGLPGMIDVPGGAIIQSMPLCVTQRMEFVEFAQSVAKVPVLIENDARSCCYTERMVSEKIGECKNSMYVMVEFRKQNPSPDAIKNISVGVGLVMNGRIYNGSNSIAGEFRSMFCDGANQTQFKSETKSIVSLDDKDAVVPVFKELAKNIAFIVNTLALDVVYVGGIDKVYTQEIVKYIQEEVDYMWPYEWHKTATVTSATISDAVVSYGAACMVLDKLFSVPEIDPSVSGTLQGRDHILLHLPL